MLTLDCCVLEERSRRACVVRRNLCCQFAVVPDGMADILPQSGNHARIILLTPAVKNTVVVSVDDSGVYPFQARASDESVSRQKCGGANVLLPRSAAWRCYDTLPTCYPSNTARSNFDKPGVRLLIV
jgi:hypothetical protein